MARELRRGLAVLGDLHLFCSCFCLGSASSTKIEWACKNVAKVVPSDCFQVLLWINAFRKNHKQQTSITGSSLNAPLHMHIWCSSSIPMSCTYFLLCVM